MYPNLQSKLEAEFLKRKYKEFFYFDISTRLGRIKEDKIIETIQSEWNKTENVRQLDVRDILEDIVYISTKYSARVLTTRFITAGFIGLSEGTINLDETARMLLCAIGDIRYEDFCRKFAINMGRSSIEEFLDGMKETEGIDNFLSKEQDSNKITKSKLDWMA